MSLFDRFIIEVGLEVEQKPREGTRNLMIFDHGENHPHDYKSHHMRRSGGVRNEMEKERPRRSRVGF